ncbi:MAG: hypothetical protein Q9186_002769 [Xanthomendoza sp. 1 TL-2023]
MYYPCLLLLHLLLQTANAQLKPCFRPNGDYAEDFPCNPEADVSACCGGNWICGTSLYCKSKSGTLVVGTCTDRSWGSDNIPACPFPLNAGNYVPNLDHFDYELNTTRCSADDSFCPNNNFSDNNQTCCDRHQGKKEVFFQNDAVIPKAKADLSSSFSPSLFLGCTSAGVHTDTNTQNVFPAYYASVGYTIPTDGVYKTETYSTATATTRSSSSITAAGATSTANPAPVSSTPAPSTGLSTGAKAGIGVGVALGVLILAAAAVLLWMRRRKTVNGEREKQNYGRYSGVSQDPSGPHQQQQTTDFYKSSELGEGQPTMELDSRPYGGGNAARHEMQA